MIKIIKNLFSNKKNERENNINDLFSDIDKLNNSLLEKNQKMISSYYNNEKRWIKWEIIEYISEIQI